MRSRTARFTLMMLTWIAVIAAGAFLFTTERQLTERRASLSTFEQTAHDAVAALAELRVSQHGYIAQGQSASFWMTKTDQRIADASASVDRLRASAMSDTARSSLLGASSALTEFGNVDKRVREYLHTNEPLMASDVVFSEGDAAIASATLGIDAGGVAEHEAASGLERTSKRAEMLAAAGAAAFVILGALLLAPLPRSKDAVAEEEPAAAAEEDETVRIAPRVARIEPAPAPAPPAPVPDTSLPALRAAAELCTEFGRLRDTSDLKGLLGSAARLLDASGLVVWLGSPAGADLRPVFAHGYSDQVLALMRPVPRMADNAAAAAYRSSMLQIVGAKTGALGALAAPLVSPDGCIGALTAEIKDGREQSAATQALAAILAAQLAGGLADAATSATAPRAAVRSAV